MILSHCRSPFAHNTRLKERHNSATGPEFLSDQKAQELTQQYAKTGASVWNKDRIKEPLLLSTAKKCAYCETDLDEESKYMEVEHFRCKKDFPDQVVEWENLLPSCKRCNGRKSSHNVETDGEIVNPYDTNPSAHIYFQNYRLYGYDDIGKRTIDTLYLNQSDRLVSVRWKLGDSVSSSLGKIRNSLEEYQENEGSQRKWREITRGVEKLLEESQSKSQYSALVATVLLSDPNVKRSAILVHRNDHIM